MKESMSRISRQERYVFMKNVMSLFKLIYCKAYKIMYIYLFSVNYHDTYFQTQVRAEMGPQSYMLSEFEELWEKKLPEVCEELLR